MVLQTIIEIAILILLAIGFANEEKVADFEQRLYKKIKGRKTK